jgi:hypothetical protein
MSGQGEVRVAKVVFKVVHQSSDCMQMPMSVPVDSFRQHLMGHGEDGRRMINSFRLVASRWDIGFSGDESCISERCELVPQWCITLVGWGRHHSHDAQCPAVPWLHHWLHYCDFVNQCALPPLAVLSWLLSSSCRTATPLYTQSQAT